jgi:uncharacterized protein
VLLAGWRETGLARSHAVTGYEVRAAPAAQKRVAPAGSRTSRSPAGTWTRSVARTQQFYADLFGWTVDSSAFPGYATVDTGTGRGIQGGLGGGEEARWATIYASVADMDQILSRAEKLGGSRISDPGLSALKSAARAAIYGPSSVDDHMETGAFRDPAGNVFGVYHAED